MRTAIFPGTFDPPTLGHENLIRRAASMTDHLIVAVLNNYTKTPLFSVKERVTMLQGIVSDLDNVEVCSFDGLLVSFAQEKSASVIIRGLRNVTDYLYEQQMAEVNHMLCHGVETVFLLSDPRFSSVSSSAVREIAQFGGDVSQFVSNVIAEAVQRRCKYKGENS